MFEINEDFYTIFPKRPGRLEPELNDEQKQRLGRFLARLHNVGSAVKKAPRITLHPNTYGRESLRFLMDNKLLPPSVEPHFKQLVNQICDQIQPYFEGVEYFCRSTETAILAMFSGRATNPTSSTSTICSMGRRSRISGCCPEETTSTLLKNRNDILDAYEEIRPFDHTTLRLIEPLTLRMIHFTAWIARRWEDGAFKMAFPPSAPNVTGRNRSKASPCSGKRSPTARIRVSHPHSPSTNRLNYRRASRVCTRGRFLSRNDVMNPAAFSRECPFSAVFKAAKLTGILPATCLVSWFMPCTVQ